MQTSNLRYQPENGKSPNRADHRLKPIVGSGLINLRIVAFISRPGFLSRQAERYTTLTLIDLAGAVPLLDRKVKEYITSLDIDALWMRNTGGCLRSWLTTNLEQA